MPSEGNKVSSPATPSDALIDAIRALVQEELGRSAPSQAAERRPTWQDGFWLLVLISNIVLLFGLIPDQWWKDPVLEIPSKILPWLGGGTFVLGATWFRDRLLAFSRSRTIKTAMACALVPLLLLHVPFVSLQPKIDPPDLQFYVDGTQRKGSFQGQARIWLRLANHTFKIQPHDKSSTNERVIDWSWKRLLGAWWEDQQPQWALTYPVTIVTDGMGCKVQISKANSEEQLDTDFYDSRVKRVANSLEFEPNSTSEIIKLPGGTYAMLVFKQKCETQKHSAPVKVPSDQGVEFEEMKCPMK